MNMFVYLAVEQRQCVSPTHQHLHRYARKHMCIKVQAVYTHTRARAHTRTNTCVRQSGRHLPGGQEGFVLLDARHELVNAPGRVVRAHPQELCLFVCACVRKGGGRVRWHGAGDTDTHPWHRAGDTYTQPYHTKPDNSLDAHKDAHMDAGRTPAPGRWRRRAGAAAR